MNQPAEQKSELRDSDQYVTRHGLRKIWKRSMSMAHGRTQAERLRQETRGKPILHKAKEYLKIQVLQWVWHYVRSRFGRRWPFADYAPYEDDNGIYPLTAKPEDPDSLGPVRISLLGDWGSGTQEALDVAERVLEDSPDFTIHLGDIYYVGTKKEVRENMLGGKVLWPIGSRGSFALNANHEMYARGKAYFKYLLPVMGLRDRNGGRLPGQRASFFCLKNAHWLVIGLDTGYYSVGAPIFEKIFKPSAKLHSKLLEWLTDDVGLPDDHQRGIVLLSHHQYYSQFESGYERSARQLARLVDRPVLWFWGHEHRFAIYGKHATKKGRLQVYGRCVGHGGLPIEDIVDEPKRRRKNRVGLVLYDGRERARISKARVPVGYNGYANLQFEARTLTVEYKDTEQALVREVWEVGDNGVLNGVSIERLVDHDDLKLYDGATLERAIE